MRKKFLLLILLVALAAFPALSHARDFVIKDYVFSWEVTKIGNVSLKIVKEPSRTLVVLSSMGGKIATVYLTGGQAEDVGKVLEKTGEYYKKYKEKWDRGSSDVVKVGAYRVTFSSSEGVKDFKVTLDQDKLFSPMVHFTKESAPEIAKHLEYAEEMVAHVDKRIKP